MKHELVSVIVPVYNVEAFLDRCVTSILNQSYPNLEVLLVDDGSTDNSPALCDVWAAHDPRVTVIHKKNGGQADARNVGLDRASGTYISFVDSDDYIAENFIDTLYSLLCQYQTDISAVGVAKVNFIEPTFLTSSVGPTVTLFQGADAIKELFTEDTYACYPVNRLYKRKLFDTIRFPVNRVMEDLAIAHKILIAAGQIVYSDEKLYYYYQREGSTVHHLTRKFFQDRMDMIVERYKVLEALYPDMVENDFYLFDMVLGDYPIVYRSARNPELEQLTAHAYEKCRSTLTVWNKIRFAIFKRNKALFNFIERQYRGLAQYDNS